MEARDYFSTMQSEVDSWKEKAHEAIGRFDHVPTAEMEKLRPFLDELKEVVEGHIARLEDLSTFCPRELSPPRSKSRRFAKLKEFWDEVGRYYQHRPPHL
jgi:hypothetical protein